MKAAVLHALGTVPVYEETALPDTLQTDETLLRVEAVAIKNLDKARAAGTHYANYSTFPAIMGMDAIGRLENGQRVFAPEPVGGTLAEWAVVKTRSLIPLPEHLNAAEAAAFSLAESQALGIARTPYGKAAIKAFGVSPDSWAQMIVQLAKQYKQKDTELQELHKNLSSS